MSRSNNFIGSSSKLIYLTMCLSCVLVECAPPPHPLVVQVRKEEDQLLGSHRNPKLLNPYLREVLPLSTLLHPGEELVYDRPTDTVSRSRILEMLTHAGFVRRKPNFNNGAHLQPPAYHTNLLDLPQFPSQDLLQYL